MQLPLAALAVALLVGFSGGRWMTAEAEKRLNQGTAVLAAQAAEEALESVGSLAAMTVTQVGRDCRGGERLSRIVQTESPLQACRAARELNDGTAN
jgi:hypothetical protein